MPIFKNNKSDSESDGMFRDSIQSSNRARRRNAKIWSGHESSGSINHFVVHTVSIMKVHSQEDSLQAIKAQAEISSNVSSSGLLQSPLKSVFKKISIISPHLQNDASLGSDDNCIVKNAKTSDKKDDNSKNVGFGEIIVREYEVDAGDAPGVSGGVAVSIGWQYSSETEIGINQWEEQRGPRREMHEMKLTREERETRLLSSGLTRSEINKMRKRNNVAEKRRKKTLATMKYSHVHEALEKVKRKSKAVFRGSMSDQEEEDDLWTNAQTYKKSRISVEGLLRRGAPDFDSN